MEATDLLAMVPLLLSSGVIGSGITALVSWRLNVRADERLARRDEWEEDHSLAGQLMSRVGQLETRLGVVESALDRAREDRIVLDDHIDVLEAHIWQGKPPPPPARPKL